MPNWGGGNTRAIEARQRKAAVKAEARDSEVKKKEEALWRDDLTEQKLNKKEEQLAKQHEKLQRKAELRTLAEQEEAKFLSSKKSTEGPKKPTRAEIQQRALQAKLAALKVDDSAEPSPFDMENPNRALAEEERRLRAEGKEYLSASSVGEYIEQIAPETGADRFPTKRLKAAYAAYEEEWMAKFRAENPTLKRSQLKDRIWKQWQKAPENPMNQV